VVRLVVAVLLARLLTRHEYGIAGMVLVFMSFVLIFADIGLGNALVQRRTLTEDDYCTAFWTSAATGTFFTLAAVALSGPIASFFHEPAIQPMIAVLSLSFVMQGLALTQAAVLVRAMAFRALELRWMISTFIGGAVGIAFAFLGFGAWAIVALHLTSTAVGTVLVWMYSSWRPQLRFSRTSLRALAGFSSNVFGTGLLEQLRGTTDNMLVGRYLGAAALGPYALAYNLVLMPLNRIAFPLGHVLFPVLSRIQNDHRKIVHYWIRSLRLIAVVTLPACVGLVLVGADAVVVVLGEKWQPAIRIVQLLAVVGMLQTLQFLNPFVLQAVDRTSTLLRWSLVTYLVCATAFVIGLHWGVVGVAAAYAVASVVAEPFYARATAHAVGIRLRDLIRPQLGVVQATIVMAIVVFATRQLTIQLGLSPSLRLLIVVPLGIVTLAAACRWRVPELVAELRVLRARRAGGASAAIDPLIADERAPASSTVLG
jgi:O-antigen/teichoic acid export membrane protein